MVIGGALTHPLMIQAFDASQRRARGGALSRHPGDLYQLQLLGDPDYSRLVGELLAGAQSNALLPSSMKNFFTPAICLAVVVPLTFLLSARWPPG
jgi:PTS system beta-glucosides-specific IIC component